MKRVVLVLGLAGLLAGCGGSGKATAPQALPPVGPSDLSNSSTAAAASPTPAPTRPRPSPVPAIGSHTSEPGGTGAGARSAEAFARDWVHAVNRAYEEVDPGPLLALSDASCVSCNNNVEQLRRDASRGLRYRGGTNRIIDLAAPPVQDGGTSVLVVVTVDEQEVVDGSGHVQRVLPAIKSASLNLRVHRVNGAWRVAEVTR